MLLFCFRWLGFTLGWYSFLGPFDGCPFHLLCLAGPALFSLTGALLLGDFLMDFFLALVLGWVFFDVVGTY